MSSRKNDPAPATVQDVMKPVEVLASSASVADAAKAMKEGRVNMIPVGEQEDVRGVVTSRDVAIAAVAESANPAGIPVEDIAQPMMAFCGEDEKVNEAVRRMDAAGVDQLLVRGAEGKVVGVIAANDALEAISVPGKAE